MRFPIVPLLFLALPFIEIAGFVIVGRQIGVLATLGLVVAAALLGAVLLRIQGFGVMSRIRAELDAGGDPSSEVAKGAMVLVAAILLLIPGFFTDIFGLLLFLPPVRELAWRFLKSRIAVSSVSFGGFSVHPGAGRPGGKGPGGARDRTIDLDEEEYSHEPKQDSPWRRIDRD